MREFQEEQEQHKTEDQDNARQGLVLRYSDISSASGNFISLIAVCLCIGFCGSS